MKTLFWKKKYDAPLPECPPGHHVLGKYNQCSICGTHIAPNNIESATAAVVDRYAPPDASRTAPQPAARGYPGSKGGNGVWHQIVAQIPPHDLYIEAFAGSAQVLLRMRPPAAVIAIDCDEKVCAALTSTIAARADLTGVTTVVCDTAAQWLYANARRFNQRTVIYCDPPYPAEVRAEAGRAYYGRELDLPSQHKALIEALERIRQTGACILLSGYRCDLYDRLLSNWRRLDYRAMTRGGPVTESLWCNYPEPAELHDPRVAGSNFRERERIKRKARSWVKMLTKMKLADRAAVIAAIDEWRHGAGSQRQASSH